MSEKRKNALLKGIVCYKFKYGNFATLILYYEVIFCGDVEF